LSSYTRLPGYNPGILGHLWVSGPGHGIANGLSWLSRDQDLVTPSFILLSFYIFMFYCLKKYCRWYSLFFFGYTSIGAAWCYARVGA
jgi:hypothetical protein